MAFVSDQLYNGYLRRNLGIIVSRVKPIDIMIYLPCLTPHDRENIEAKTETRGKYDGMTCLLDCLRRREHWPEQFIQALEACEHHTLAAEVRAEYDALRGVNNSNPSSPPTTMVRAHVHPTPSASHLPVPESGGGGGAESRATAAEAPPAPTEPAAEVLPSVKVPMQLEDPQSTDESVPEPDSQPEPVSEPPQMEVVPPPSPPPSLPPSTPPPSPENSRTQETAEELPETESTSHQQPEENSESDVQGVSGDDGGEPPEPVNIDTTPPTHHPVEHNETDPLPQPDILQIAAATEERPQRSPSPTEINLEVTEESSVAMETPEKLPVQETVPPIDKITSVVPEPEETSEPSAEQIAEISHEKETTAATSPEPGAAGLDASPNEDDSMCLSKPSDLVSMAPPNHSCSTQLAPSSPVTLYSGNSDRLEISEAEPEAVTAAVTCSSASAAIIDMATGVACQENGISPAHSEPEENHYESLNSSLDTQDVRVNLVQVSEEPSILNLDGQTPESHAPIVNGEVAKETITPPSPADAADEPPSNLHTSESCDLPEPPPADAASETETPLNPEEKTTPQSRLVCSSNTKYILTAAGVGACALLMAWRFKN